WQQILDARPDENYIAINPWKFKLSAGYMKYTWGTADGFNPTDNINPLDLRNTLDPVKIPLLSAYIGFFPIDQLSLEVIYAPFEQADQSDIDLAATLQSQYSAINPSLSITEKISDYDLSSFILGGKVNFFFRYIDFSLSYLYNLDSAYSPIIKKTTDPTGIGLYYIPSEIDLIKRRLHHFGGDFKTNIGIFGIWGELCFTLTEDYLLNSDQIRNHKLNWIAGLEFNYGPNDDFYFNIQYFGEFIFLFDQGFYQDYEDGNFTYSENLNYYRTYYYRSMTDMLANQLEGLYQGLLINMSWPVMNSLLTPSLITGYTLPLFYDYNHEIRYGTLMIKPELDIMPIDSFHIVIGADLVFSWLKKEGEEVEINETDRFGVNYSNSNIYLELRYKWGFDLQK
ncbi:MAG: hypothetical protein MJB14_02365, partial [Spirochaetes bacterium]|nr:hypothetical protein [Spirochaetota bacterium]